MADHITRCDVNTQARILMDLIDLRSHEIEAETVLAELFVNGRERGWTLAPHSDHEISFAECRNSDSIVLYPFRWGNKNAEVDYKERTLTMEPHDFETAASFVIHYLNTGDLDGLGALLQPGGKFRRGRSEVKGPASPNAV
jgi:hypothetical protein